MPSEQKINKEYEALLVVSFGGPEGPDQVIPFLENVLRGRNVPRQRMLEVAEHYQEFGGVSPINAQNRALIQALQQELEEKGPVLPVYWGNRNWHPFLRETISEMREDGVRRALAFVTSAFSSYSGCRQYREDIEHARSEVGTSAPTIDKLRVFYNHPGFIRPNVESVLKAFAQIPAARREATALLFSAHSLPLEMAQNCQYEEQLSESCRLVADGTSIENWQLVYQSRSGPPHQPWLEPDICDHLGELGREGIKDVVLSPIGFISDHMEVLFDLDIEAQQVCDSLGINLVRAETPGTHPLFVGMIRELVLERLSEDAIRLSLGTHGPSHDVCPDDCCKIVR